MILSAARVEDAKPIMIGRLEAELMRRAVEGSPRLIYQKSELVGNEMDRSDLTFASRAMAPEGYNELPRAGAGAYCRRPKVRYKCCSRSSSSKATPRLSRFGS